MGKPTGFMEYKRETVKEIEPLERIGNWNEFHQMPEEDVLKRQGARCMDCGIPFCHIGLIFKGMAAGCPLNNLIPEWNDLIYRGKWHEAYKRLIKTNNFPEFTGRVCPAPCEGSCTESINNDPVAIKQNEYSIIDIAFSNGWVVATPPEKRTGFKVAVVGSGPAGLACADELNKEGHFVTVFEKDDQPGGILMYGIPNMKLEKNIIRRRINIMQEEGVAFLTNTEIGDNYPFPRLENDFDAVILCCGAQKARDISIPGRDAKGIYFAMDFLRENTRSIFNPDDVNSSEISAKGKNVVVIGGGDTGTDCVATSIRQGCKSIVQLEIMPKPVLHRTDGNPWPEWPRILKTDYGQEEAKALFGKDPRVFNTTSKRFIKDENDNIKQIETIKVKWQKNADKRYVPQNIEGTQKIIEADIVLLAMGFTGPDNNLLEHMGIESDIKSNVKTPEGSYRTNKDGIFSAGDMRRGQSLVVWAMREGREVAKECSAYLESKN